MSKYSVSEHEKPSRMLNLISDYDVFLSPLEDFKTEMTKAGLDDKVIYLDRGDTFKFRVQT